MAGDAATKLHIAPEEYLRLDEASDDKLQLVDGEIFAMSGASPRHVRLAMNLGVALANALRGRPCRPYGADLRIRNPAKRLYTYADLSVVCGPLELDRESNPPTLLNPTVIFEVLSESTERFDRGAKARGYREIPTLQAYVLLSQDEARVEQYVRTPAGWLLTEVGDAESLKLDAIEVSLGVRELYDGVFDEPA